MIIPIIVSYSYLQYQRSNIKSEIKQMILGGLDEDQLVRFTFAKTFVEQELHWLDGSEFEFESNLYDVVRSIKVQDSITYWCWLDVKESQIKKDIKALVTLNWNKDLPSQNQKDKLVDFYKQLISIPIESISLSCVDPKLKCGFFFTMNYHSQYLEGPLLPPELAS